jgi:hypothetical protein
MQSLALVNVLVYSRRCQYYTLCHRPPIGSEACSGCRSKQVDGSHNFLSLFNSESRIGQRAGLLAAVANTDHSVSAH